MCGNPRAGSLGVEAEVACEYLAPHSREGVGLFFGRGSGAREGCAVADFKLRRLVRLALALLSPLRCLVVMRSFPRACARG
jgi:hypothetical protein